MKARISLVFLLLGSPLLAIDTTIKGGSMELRDKGEKVLFKGGVVLKRGTDRLTAREMETTKKRDLVKAKGKVKLFRRLSTTETVKGFGKKGFYDTRSGEGYLVGGLKRAHIVYEADISTSQTRRLDIYSKRFDFWEDQSRATAKENVYGKSVDPETGDVYEFWSDKADYLSREKKIVLTGEEQPRVFQKTQEDQKEILGDVIIYYIDDRRFVAEGDAQALFLQDNKKEKAEP